MKGQTKILNRYCERICNCKNCKIADICKDYFDERDDDNWRRLPKEKMYEAINLILPNLKSGEAVYA